jgi:uncharacterized damage-inducible protein DinB
MEKQAVIRSLTRSMRQTLAAFAWPARTLARSYGPGKWTGKQVLGHLVDCELVFLTRLRFLLAEEEPQVVPFQQDAWASRFRYQAQDSRRMKELFRLLRGEMIRLAREAKPSDLARRGKHPENPNYTAEWLVVHAAEHTDHHLGQLAAIKAGRPWTPDRKA